MYVYPKLSQYDLGAFRLFGPGLANLLFPWARAIVIADRSRRRLIWPAWPQIKIGPILRLEKDSRNYGHLFQPSADYVTGWKKAWSLCSLPRIPEADESGDRRKNVLEVTGMQHWFQPLHGHQSLVRKNLLQIIRPDVFPASRPPADIALHVRRGDFASPKDGSTHYFNMRIPDEWYIEAVRAAQEAYGGRSTVHVYSDASREDLGPLLKAIDGEVFSSGTAIGDLIELSRARVLIGSRSTFSMWAAFLGEGLSVWFPGKPLSIHGNTDTLREVDFNPRAAAELRTALSGQPTRHRAN
jgi:hypothetical protein